MARDMIRRRRYCRFSAEGIKEVDYKDVDLLKDFILENGKVIPARITGTINFLYIFSFKYYLDKLIYNNPK